MFDSLKKKLKEGLGKLSKTVAEKEETSLEREEEFAHRPEESVGEILKEEPDKIEEEAEREEHFEEEDPPDKPLPEAGKERLEERESLEERQPLEEREIDKEESLERRGFLGRLKGLPSTVTEKTLAADDIDAFVKGVEAGLLSANVAVEVVDFFRDTLKQELADQKIRRGTTAETIRAAFERALLQIVDQGTINLVALAAAKKPLTLLFLGFNGSGKTTSIAKVARYLQAAGLKPVLAAADTFRAASIEQLEHHGEKLKVKVVRHQYGADPAAVIFDACKHASANRLDVVLADTAGRTHVNKNLIDELKKIVRVNKPDLKILVIDSLTGNDAVEQARLFNEAVGVDAIVLTKLDANKKGGSLLSVSYAIKKPILFLGTGQGYGDLVPFRPQEFVKELLG